VVYGGVEIGRYTFLISALNGADRERSTSGFGCSTPGKKGAGRGGWLIPRLVCTC